MKKIGIVIFGGGMVKDKDRWRTTDFNDPLRPEKTGGSKIRVTAGSILYKKQPCLIISSGGRNRFYRSIGAPNISSVMKKELMSLGVPEKDIFESPNHQNTYQEIQGLKKILISKKISDISIISNKYHLPRIKALIKYDPKKNNLSHLAKVNFINAESIAIKHNPGEWTKKIKKAYHSKTMKRKIELENKGIREIKAGTYKFT